MWPNRWGPKDWVDGERVHKVLSGGRMPTESPKKALLRENGGVDNPRMMSQYWN